MLVGGLDAGDQQLGRTGRHHTVVAPFEQRETDRALDPGEGLGQGGLGQVHRAGGRAHRAQLSDPGDGGKVAQIEAPDIHLCPCLSEN